MLGQTCDYVTLKPSVPSMAGALQTLDHGHVSAASGGRLKLPFEASYSLHGLKTACIINLAGLHVLQVHLLAVGNALSGTIPSSLSAEAPGLQVLLLSNNLMSGTIPADFVNLTKLEQASFVSTLLSCRQTASTYICFAA